jgi:hypothetical protein
MIFDELIGKFAPAGTTESLEAETAVDRIQQADASNRLQVYIVPYYLCLAPALIDNPDNRDECCGLTLHLEKGGDVKIYEIRERNITHWRQMYYDLESGVLGEYRRLEFSKYRNVVMRIPSVT